MTIWKFTLKVTDKQQIMVPQGARLLSVQMQGEVPRLWALVNPEADLESRCILTFGTGHPVPDGLGPYLGSYQLQDGGFVFHVFGWPEL